VNSKRLIAAARWLGVCLGVATIVAIFRTVVHANPATVALTFLLLILFVAANWGLRYAIVTSLIATACYNFFFLPPLDTFTVSDPENVLALAAFLITSVFASRSSNRIRMQSRDARERQAELEVLYRLGRALLQSDEVSSLSNAIPTAIEIASGARAVVFYLVDSETIYRAGVDWAGALSVEQLQDLADSPAVSYLPASDEAVIPLRTGVRPRGVLLLRGVRLSTRTLEAIGGLVSGSLDRARAVSELTRAEASRESERLRGWMVDSITHELRTPLTSIKASVTTMLTSKLPEASARELLTIIDEEADRLNRLVAEATDMAQLDSQEVRMNLEPHSLAQMIDHALGEKEAMLAQHPIDIRLPATLPSVMADPVWMAKVLDNLLDNAVKYSSPGSPIFISAEVRGDDVACSIADRGSGIDPLEQSLIFDKFYRSPNRRASSPGTGMGLAICRAILETHGGAITVTSQVGQGSVFTFTLPVARRA
jgi:two-component system sensor histidine kinase KdpD